MPDLFFYRDPEEVEREEAAKEAEVIYVVIDVECRKLLAKHNIFLH